MAKQKWTNATHYVPAKMLEDRVHFSSSDVIRLIECFENNLGEFGSEYTWKNAHKHHSLDLYRCLRDQGLSLDSCCKTLLESLYYWCNEASPSGAELGEIADYVNAIIDDATSGSLRSGSGSYYGTQLFARFLPERIDLLGKVVGAGLIDADRNTWQALIDSNFIALADIFARERNLPEGRVIVGGAVGIEMLEWLINHGVAIEGMYLSCCREVLERCDSLDILPVGFSGWKSDEDKTCLISADAEHLDREALVRRLSSSDEELQFRVTNGVLRGYHGSEEHVTVPSGVTEVKGGFEDNQTVRSITFPEGVQQIGDTFDYPFAGCRNLERVYLPSTINKIEWKSFTGCDNLGAIEIDQRCKKYFSIDGVAAEEQHFGIQKAFFPNKMLSEGTFVIPSGLGHIDAVFAAPVSSVKKLVLPKSVDYTGMLTENTWESLETIEVPSDSRKYKYIDGALIRLNTQFGDGKRRNVLIRCLPTRTEEVFEVPAKTGSIESWAFKNCKNLKKVVLPDSVARIERYAFSGIGNKVHLVLPQKLEYVFDCKCDIVLFGGSFDGFSGIVEYPGTTLPFGPKAFGWSNEPDVVLMLPNIPPSELPAAFKNPAAIGYTMLRLRGDNIEDSVSEEYAKYIKSNKKKLFETIAEHEQVAIYMMEEGLLAAKDLPIVSSIAEGAGNDGLVARLQEYSNAPKKPTVRKKVQTKAQQETPIEPLVAEWLQKVKVDPTIKRAVKSGLPLSDGEGECSAEALQLLIELCSFPRKHAYRAAMNNSHDFEHLEYLVEDENTYGPDSSWLAEDERLTKPRGSWSVLKEISSWFDRGVLSERLEKLFFDEKLELALVALAFYGNDAAIQRLTRALPDWESYNMYGYRGRKDISIARGAMLYNDSLEVVRYFASVKKAPTRIFASLLGAYARIHRTTEDALRDSLIPVKASGMAGALGKSSELTFDMEGKAVIDLGIKTITAIINDDLRVTLFDDEAGKVVKTLPKRGVDPAVYEREKARLAALRKNVSDAVKQRKMLLFNDFLSGSDRGAEVWRKSYYDNPIIRCIARLIVWQQGDATFTVNGASLIDSSGNPYELSAERIRVAHPMEMDSADVKAWRDYFARNGLKQPFEQVWERVVDAKTVKPDRYAGYPIPYYRFKGQEKIGIRIFDSDFHNDIRIDFVVGDCKGKTKRLDWHRHRIEMNDRFEIEDFGLYRNSRKANHLIAYLDRCCIYPRIANNDMSVMEELDTCTLAQLIDYTDAASENGATELAAALLAYREERFPEYGSVESLLLN